MYVNDDSIGNIFEWVVVDNVFNCCKWVVECIYVDVVYDIGDYYLCFVVGGKQVCVLVWCFVWIIYWL